MAEKVADLMTRDPVALSSDTTATEAARVMRDKDVGPVLVKENGGICGIVTDRDIVVRALAEGRNPDQTRLGDICSRDLETLSPDQSLDEAVRLMRKRDVRRLPVLEGDKPVGIVSLGDLAQERDERSALADISAAPPNQ